MCLKVSWTGRKDGMAVTKAFTITSLPFLLAEAEIGVASLFTGLLQILPLFGPGTAIDMAILLFGLAVTALRILKPPPIPTVSDWLPIKGVSMGI